MVYNLAQVYGSVIETFAASKKRLNISRQEIEDVLAVQLGITREETLDRHISLMVRLGYLKVAEKGLTKYSTKYDIVAEKVPRKNKTEKPIEKDLKPLEEA